MSIIETTRKAWKIPPIRPPMMGELPLSTEEIKHGVRNGIFYVPARVIRKGENE
jgi:hypothetical protein